MPNSERLSVAEAFPPHNCFLLTGCSLQVQRSTLRMIELGRTGAPVFDVVTGPECGETLAGDAQFANKLNEFAIERLRAEHGSVRDYVASLGVSAAAIDSLADGLLEQAAE